VAGINALDPNTCRWETHSTIILPRQTSLNGVQAPYPGWAAQMTGCAPSVAQALLPYPHYCNSFYSINENAGSSTFTRSRRNWRSVSVPGFGFWDPTRSASYLNSDDVQRIDSGAAFAFSPFERQRYKSLSTGDVPHSFSATLVTNCRWEREAVF